MNFGLIDVLVDNHICEIRRTVSRPRTVSRGHGPAPASSAGRARLRSRIGFVLVEVGLHLQATAGRRSL
jgi:hypothetical protein